MKARLYGICVLISLASSCGGKVEQTGAEDSSVDAARRAKTMAFWSAYRSGLAHARENRMPAARESLAVALALEPTHESALYEYGNVNFALGRYDEAGHAWRTLVREHPHSARGFAQLGALHACGRDSTPFDPATAESWFRKMYAVNKESSEATIRLGESLLLQRRYDEATALFDRAIAFDPENPRPRILKGTALWMRGDTSRAVAVARPPETPEPGDRPFASEEGDTKTGSLPMLAEGARAASFFSRTVDRIVSGEPPGTVLEEASRRMKAIRKDR